MNEKYNEMINRSFFVNALKKPLTLFVSSRYIIYTLQFIRGIALAVILGPSLYGIWGSLLLVQAYLMYGTLGVEFALNVILSTEKKLEQKRIDQLVSTSILVITIMSCILLILGSYFQFGGIELFKEFRSSKYAILLSLFIITSYFQQVFVNIYRFYGSLRKIVFVELISVCITIFPILFFSTEALIYFMLVSFIVSTMIGNIIYLVKAPFRIQFTWEVNTLSYILSLAIPLFIYNLTTNLMSLFVRTVVSVFYSIEALGFYTFAFNISNSIFLGLSAISWALFPGLLSGMRDGIEDQEVVSFVHKTNNLYGNSAFMVVMVAIAASPLLFIYFPKYKPVLGLLGLLLISQGIGALALGYGSLIYSRKKIMLMTLLNIAGVTTGISLSIGIASFGILYVYVALMVIVGQLVQLLLFVQASSKLIKFNMNYWTLIGDLFSFGRVIAIISVVIGVVLDKPVILNLLGTGLYFIFDRKQIRKVYEFVIEHVRA